MKTNHFSRAFLLAGFVLLSTTFFAQNLFEIKGKVIQNKQENPTHATVMLLDSKTMEIVAQSVSSDNGEFVIKEVKKGDYILIVQKPGYTKPDKRFISIDQKGTVIENPGMALQKSDKKADEPNVN